MSINFRTELSYGNIKKVVEKEVLPHQLYCPICESVQDGIVCGDDLYTIEAACGCDMDEHNQELNDANDIIEARDDTIHDLEMENRGYLRQIDYLEGRVGELERELEYAKS